ncbi:hypothetical protein PENSPDRAFT_363928 [Peniophora sp. CONT]|nr:hypothetical protein PENSPDRAFT_363928 [Peniophora sp. CONT]
MGAAGQLHGTMLGMWRSRSRGLRWYLYTLWVAYASSDGTQSLRVLSHHCWNLHGPLTTFTYNVLRLSLRCITVQAQYMRDHGHLNPQFASPSPNVLNPYLLCSLSRLLFICASFWKLVLGVQ